MDKLNRYLGLVLATALLMLAFFPAGPNPYFPAAAKVTPLDHTLLSRLSYHRQDDYRLWSIATDHFSSCPPFQTEVRRDRDAWGGRRQCNSGPYLLGTAAIDLQAELVTFEPKAAELIQRLANISRGARIDGLRDNSEVRELELQIGQALEQYLNTQRAGLAVRIYYGHAVVLILGILMFVFRGAVGSVLTWPFRALFDNARAGAKVAKKLHEKV